MEYTITPDVLSDIQGFIKTSKHDDKAEFECKLLAGKIQTKDVADRLLTKIKTLCIPAPPIEENRLTLSFADQTRVNVIQPHFIHNVCTSNSFKGIPVIVERKERAYNSAGAKDTIDIADYYTRFTLRKEVLIRKDWDGNPADPKAYIRILSRKSFTTFDGLFRIDFSMVKSRGVGVKQSIPEVLKQPVTYELEIEFIGKKSDLSDKDISTQLIIVCDQILQSYYQSPFTLSVADITRYEQEFKSANHTFYNVVTMSRKHLLPPSQSATSIYKNYTVTNKADGERSGLYVARDKKLLRITPNNQITWTGITANTDTHIGDFIDGEYIFLGQDVAPLFCIFDVYRYKNADTRKLPLMAGANAGAGASRLDCARKFVEDLRTEFTIRPSLTPFRIETKLFLSGDGLVMEEAINQLLNTQYEYKIDGLIFTPKLSTVAPAEDRKGKTWLRVYKWKPANLNSIDFLLKIAPNPSIDPLNRIPCKSGELYVSRTPNEDIIYPRETMTGEYVPKALPADLQKIANMNTRIPSVFQPAIPRDPDAYKILLKVDTKGVPIDEENTKIEDNTIVECAYDTETRRWTVLRTRYDKTYQYRVLREPQFGNDIAVANNIWTSMHIPISEKMIREFVSTPNNVADIEDDMYYRDDLKRASRLFNDVYNFHNKVKEQLYKTYVNKGAKLLELAVGRAGDLHKWKKVKPDLVVGVDISLSNIISPTQGAAVRYITDKKQNPRDYLPPVLFLQGDMSVFPLFGQDDRYMKYLTGDETPPTEYLEKFKGITVFDDISCQFAMHYACGNEETFRSFTQNLVKYSKSGTTFFGTCLDGQSVYTLLAGKTTHSFGRSGEITKQYTDTQIWSEEFGMPIKVFLESFENPELEYLVPFEKCTAILLENDFELVKTDKFSDLATSLSITLTEDQQTFSFLNRTFAFRRRTAPAPAPAEAPELTITEQLAPAPVLADEPKKRKLKKGGSQDVVEAKPILFFGADESKGPYRNFSNMSSHPIEINGIKYLTVEHYFQAMKAKEFEDAESYDKILKVATPKAVKALGRLVKNFNDDAWNTKRDEVMKLGVRTKFIQHPELRKQLLATGDDIIGEANPRDLYWGIGSSTEQEKSAFPSKWRGQNNLGKLLMNLRKEFKVNE